MKSFKAITSIVLSVLLSLSLYQISAAQENKKASPPQVVLQGRVACLDESGHRLDAEKNGNQANPAYELLTRDGKRYKFSPDDLMVPIFTESRVRKMELQITALLHENDLLELIKVLAIKEGKLYDIYYFCDLCNITAYGPGPCPCCFEPLVFIEKPAK
jgi:rubrerythrin